MAVVCRRQPACDPSLPIEFYFACYGFATAGVAYSAYRWYRDFIQLEYYIDSDEV